MKRVFLALAATILIAAWALALLQSREAEAHTAATAPASLGEGFVLPPAVGAAAPARVGAAVTAAAQATGSTVSRSVSGYIDGAPTTTLYVVSAGPTGLTDRFPLESGRFLTSAETQDGSTFLATGETGDPRQVGRIRALGSDPHLSIRPLAEGLSAVGSTGTYYSECPEHHCGEFRTQLASALSALPGLESLTAASLVPQGHSASVTGGGWSRILSVCLWTAIAVLALLSAYRQLADTKRAGVLLLHGRRPLTIWWRVSARPLLPILGATLVLGTAAALCIPGTSVAFLLGWWSNWALVSGAVLVASLIALPVISGLSLSTALRGRRQTTALFYFGTAITTLLTAGVIIFGSTTWGQYASFSAQQARLQGWEASAGYATFSPTSLGMNGEQSSERLRALAQAEDGALYDALNREGALYVGTRTATPGLSEEQRAEEEATLALLPALTVNTNYLRAFPVHGLDSAAITVPDTVQQPTILVPTSRRGEEQALRTAIAQTHSPAIDPQSISIVWTQPEQEVLTLNPALAPGNGGRLRDPVIAVLTAGNSSATDRMATVTGSASGALKVPVSAGGSTATLRELQPLLQSLHLEDKLTSLQTIPEVFAAERVRVESTLAGTMITAIALLAVMLLLAAHSASLLFDRYARRIVVRGMFGVRGSRRYREWTVQMMATGALVLVIAVIGAVVQATGSVSYTESSSTAIRLAHSVLLFIGVFALQGAASWLMLRVAERRKSVTILKGETL